MTSIVYLPIGIICNETITEKVRLRCFNFRERKFQEKTYGLLGLKQTYNYRHEARGI